MEPVQQSVRVPAKRWSEWEVSFGRAIGFGFFVPPFFVLAAFLSLVKGGVGLFPFLLTAYPIALLLCGPFAAIAAGGCMRLVKGWVQEDLTLTALQVRCLAVGGLSGTSMAHGLNVFFAFQEPIAIAAGIVGAGCGFVLPRIALIPRRKRLAAQPVSPVVQVKEETTIAASSESMPDASALPAPPAFVGPPAPHAAETPLVAIGTMRELAVVGVALMMSLLCEAFLRIEPLGMNVLIGASLLCTALGVVARWQQVALLGHGRWLVGPALFFAASFAWRDSPTLHWINGLALLSTLLLIARYTRSGQLQHLYLSQWAAGIGQSFSQTLKGLVVLTVSDIEWRELANRSNLSQRLWTDQSRAVSRGLGLAVPFVLFFGELFRAADVAFENLTLVFFRIFRWPGEALVSHLFFIAVFTWLASGWLRSALFTGEHDVRVQRCPPSDTLGAIETCIVLGVLNVLFVTFVYTQIPYLFGGAERIATTAGLTYALYAKRGFFELVSVAVCVLPLLLFAHWIFPSQNPRHVRLFRSLGGGLMSLVCVIMLSAAQRMYFYQHVYGLTELRLYATVFMAWLAVVCVWFLVTVLRDQRQRFAFGMFVSGLATLIVLNVLNPDALIVRTNIKRTQSVVRFDAGYASALSADAVPALLEAWPHLQRHKQRVVAKVFLSRRAVPATHAWQTWNWSRTRARYMLAEKRAVLQAAVH